MNIKNFFLSLPFQKKIPEALPSNPSTLVVSTTGLGDTLWALPALSALKRHFSSSSISLLTTDLGKELLQDHPSIDQIYLYPNNFFSLYRRLFKKFDVIFLFHASQRVIFPFCRMLQPKQLIGTKGQNKGLDHLFTHIVPWKKPHEAMRRIEQIEVLGIKDEEFDYRLHLPKKGKKILDSLNLKSPIIALHPGAKDFYKCWPLKHFITLAQMLRKENFSILFTRGENDPLIPKEFPTLSSAAIKEFAAELSYVDLLVTNDTGPMHLAASLDVPTLSLFGPTNPDICGPLGEKAHIIQKRKSCFSCLKRRCQEPFCLMQISPEEVLTKIKKILL